MGTQTSSLAKSASSETEEIPKLEIKQRGEGGPKVHHDLSEVSSDVFDSDSDTDFESDSDDEEGMYSFFVTCIEWMRGFRFSNFFLKLICSF